MKPKAKDSVHPKEEMSEVKKRRERGTNVTFNPLDVVTIADGPDKYWNASSRGPVKAVAETESKKAAGRKKPGTKKPR